MKYLILRKSYHKTEVGSEYNTDKVITLCAENVQIVRVTVDDDIKNVSSQIIYTGNGFDRDCFGDKKQCSHCGFQNHRSNVICRVCGKEMT